MSAEKLSDLPPLVLAARLGNLKGVLKELASTPTPDPEHVSAAMIGAVDLMSVDVVSSLLPYYDPSFDDHLALCRSIRSGDTRLINLLMPPVVLSQALFDAALASGSHEFFKDLCKRLPDQRDPKFVGGVMERCMKKGSLEMVRALEPYLRSVGYTSQPETTAQQCFHLACRHNRVDVVCDYLSRADPNFDNQKPIQTAFWSGSYAVIHFLWDLVDPYLGLVFMRDEDPDCWSFPEEARALMVIKHKDKWTLPQLDALSDRFSYVFQKNADLSRRHLELKTAGLGQSNKPRKI